jgi:mRNA interferase HigB
MPWLSGCRKRKLGRCSGESLSGRSGRSPGRPGATGPPLPGRGWALKDAFLLACTSQQILLIDVQSYTFRNLILKCVICVLHLCYKTVQRLVVISKTVINEFGTSHANSVDALNSWYFKVKEADWSCPDDLWQDFASADYVGNDRFVFNIKGNHYRLVAMVFFNVRTVYIKFIGTHAEYDKIDASTIELC